MSNANIVKYRNELIAAGCTLLVLGGIAYNQHIKSMVDVVEPNEQVSVVRYEEDLSRNALEKYIAQHKSDIDKEKRSELKKAFERLDIDPSEVVELTIKDAKINSETVHSYDIAENISQDKGRLIYDPPTLDSMYVTSDILGVDIDNDGDTEYTYGPLGLKNGILPYLFQAYGHTYTMGEGAADNLGKMREGSEIIATTKSGITYTFIASSDPVFPDKSNSKSIYTKAGINGAVFTCFTDNVNGRQAISKDKFTLVPIEFVAVKLKDGTQYDKRDFS